MNDDKTRAAFILGVEWGIRSAERGENLQQALDRALEAWDLFAVKHDTERSTK